MKKQYVSRPEGTLGKPAPDGKCIVYPINPSIGTEAYVMYASASGANKWEDLLAKLEAESDAVRGAFGVYYTLALENELREYFKTEQNESGEQLEHQNNSLTGFQTRLYEWLNALIAQPVPYAGESYGQIITDPALNDTVVIILYILPLNVSNWWENSGA